MGREKVACISNLIKTNDPVIFCLVETRANSFRLDRFCCRFSRRWEWASVEANGLSGGILIFWRKNLGRVTPLEVSHQALYLVVSPIQTADWILSVIYNSCRVQAQCLLLIELSAGAQLDNAANGAAGFIIVNFNSSVLLTGGCPILHATPLDVDFKALMLMLNVIGQHQASIQHIFISSKDHYEGITVGTSNSHWRVNSLTACIRETLMSIGSPQIH